MKQEKNKKKSLFSRNLEEIQNEEKERKNGIDLKRDPRKKRKKKNENSFLSPYSLVFNLSILFQKSFEPNQVTS